MPADFGFEEYAKTLSDILEPKTAEVSARSMVADFCRIDLQSLETAMGRHPALYSYAAAVYEVAKVEESRKKWNAETTKAQAFQIVMDQNRNSKMTATEAAEKVKTMPSVTSAMDAWFEAQVAVGRLKALVDGLTHRRDMIIQIAARQRAELNS